MGLPLVKPKGEHATVVGNVMAELSARQDIPDEAALLSRVRDGDRHAVDWIVSAAGEEPAALRIARSILRDDFEAEDALQEAYIRAFTSLELLPGRVAARHLARPHRDERGTGAAAAP